MLTLIRLSNALGECVGFFTDDATGHIAIENASAEWNSCLYGADRIWMPGACRNCVVSAAPAEIVDVKPGDTIRLDYSY